MSTRVFREFPKCQYHADGRCVVVANAGEELALGPGWVDRPSQLPSVVPVGVEPSDDAPLASPEPVRRRPGRPRKVVP